MDAASLEARVAEEAADWLERLERSIKAEESEALRAWLAVPLHRKVIVERCKLWHGPDILAVLGELVPVQTLSQRVERQYGRIVLAIFLCVSGISFATVVIALSKIWPHTDEHQNPLRAEATLRTSVGERKAIPLPDGSSILLNTATHVILSYGPHSRHATLVSGEALFEAKNDPERPFLVFAGGRQFEVASENARFSLRRMTQDQIAIVVLEGNVAVPAGRTREPLSPGLLRARVSTGAHTFRASEGGTLGRGWQSTWMLEDEDIDAELAWRGGSIVFVDEPLEDAIQEVERYTGQRFVATDVEIQRIRITGRFPTGDVETLLHELHDHSNVAAHKNAAGDIVLSRLVKE